jgi:hypothetical protein
VSGNQLVAAFGGDDWLAVLAAIAKVEATGDWPLALTRILRVAKPSPAISAAFHTHWIERGHRIRELVADDEIMLDALKILLPAYDGPGRVLYRGENAERWRSGLVGFAWTTQERVAQMFARGLNALHGDGGLLLCTDAPASAIIAGPNDHSIYLDEHEYVVDRRVAREIKVLQRYPRAD